MSLHKLVFDASNYSTEAASANVGAYLRSGKEGALVSNHSLVSNPSISFVFVDGDINAGSDYITESAHGLNTGDKVQFTTDGTLPSALSPATDYWIIRLSANTFQVASSPANAEAGIAIDLAADGSGNHTLTSQPVDRRALDVFVMNPLEIDVGLDHGDDSIKIGDGTDFLAINGDGSINITDNGGSITVDGTVTANQGTSPWVIGDGGGSITVDASDLDIRDLVFATDKVDVSGSSVSISGTVAVTQSTSPWVVSATDLDIRDLSHTQDSIKIGDGTDFLAINGDGSINVVVASGDPALANSAMLANAETVGVAAALIIDGGDELANRKYVMLYNNGNRVAYVGPSGVSTSSGFPIPPGSILEARIGAAVDVYMIADGANQNIRALQLS